MNSRTVALICVILALLLVLSGEHLGGSPCPGEGLHVLIIYSDVARQDMPPEQFDAVFSERLADLVKKAGGSYWRLDQAQTPKDAWAVAALGLPRASLPWVVIDNNGRGWAGPMPKTPAEHEQLLGKYISKK